MTILEIQLAINALVIAKRVLASLQQEWTIDGYAYKTTSSIGISLYPCDGTNMETLIAHADKALYDAKENGRNNIKFL